MSTAWECMIVDVLVISNAVLAMYVWNGEVIHIEDDYADGTSSTKKTCYVATVVELWMGAMLLSGLYQHCKLLFILGHCRLFMGSAAVLRGAPPPYCACIPPYQCFRGCCTPP